MRKYSFQFISGETPAAARSQTPQIGARRAKPRVLMVGMSLTKTRGGISTLIGGILNAKPLRDSLTIDYIESQAEDYAAAGKFLLALRAYAAFVISALFRPPALVYVHVGSNASLYRESLFIVLAKIFRLPTVAHFHAGDVDEYLTTQSAAGKKLIARALASSDCLIAVSKESARKLEKLTRRADIEIIVNAIDTDDFNFPPKPLRRSKDFVRLLFVGAMGKLKGERDLADAVKLLAGTYPQLRVTFLGFGGERLQRYAAEIGIAGAVEFVGAVSLAERLDFYRNADIFVLPTYAEAMPLSVIEAMAAGLPSVTTRVGGIPEMIDDRTEGLLIEPGDVSQLAAKLALLIEDESLRRRIGANARTRAARQFDFGAYAADLSARLKQIIQGKSK